MIDPRALVDAFLAELHRAPDAEDELACATLGVSVGRHGLYEPTDWQHKGPWRAIDLQHGRELVDAMAYALEQIGARPAA